jgi:hypothetical protein
LPAKAAGDELPNPARTDALLHKLTHSLSCRDVTRLLSQGEDRSLSWGERIRLRAHLLICRACAQFERQLRLLRLAMRQYRE